MADNPFAAPERAAAPAYAAPSQQDAERFLDGGATVAVKWPKVGYEFEGTVIGWRGPVPQTDMNSGEPLYWEGKKKVKRSALEFPDTSMTNPALQLLIEFEAEPTFETWESNQYVRKALPDDDGYRTMYVHGALQKAISKARREAGSGGRPAPLEEGAKCKVVRTESVRMQNDFYGHQYVAQWIPAAQNPDFQAAADQFMDKDPFGGDDGEPPL